MHASVVLGYLSHGCWETEAIYLVHGFVSACLLAWLGLATSRGSRVANMLLRGRERIEGEGGEGGRVPITYYTRDCIV